MTEFEKERERERRLKSPWYIYRKRVWELTESVAHLIPGIEKRGFKKYHIDHRFSIWYGFKLNIPPETIASINNLRMISHIENLRKGTRCDFSHVTIKIVYQ